MSLVVSVFHFRLSIFECWFSLLDPISNFPFPPLQVPHPFQVISIAHFERFNSQFTFTSNGLMRSNSFILSFFPSFSSLLFPSFVCLSNPKLKINIQFEKLNGHCPAHDIYSASESQYFFFAQICYCSLGYDTISNFEMKSCENIFH